MDVKFLIPLFLFLAMCNTSNAQINALTENGKQVTLFENGTWQYANSAMQSNKGNPITVSPIIYAKSPKATFLVKSNVVNTGVYIDPEKWTFAPHNDSETNPEYKFGYRNGDVMAMTITEKTVIDLEKMESIALTNATKAAPDARIISREYRTVNDNKILCIEMRATIKDTKFVYLNYYLSNEKGTTQFLSFTTEALFDNVKKEMETFLCGLVTVPSK